VPITDPPTTIGPRLAITAYGTPGPQGSKTPVGFRPNRRGGLTPILRESSKKVDPWRDAVALAARTALRGRPWTLLDSPLELDMHFTLARPTTPPGSRRPHPTVYPDLSKLVRSTEDALTKIVWTDDARIVRYRSLSKSYPRTGPGPADTLTRPGVIIRIWEAS
jgi:Holliday junction resolvase RusA-like endonuclease